jgi:hypothetical protein
MEKEEAAVERPAKADGYPENSSVPGPKGSVESIITRMLQRKLPMFYKLPMITVEANIMAEPRTIFKFRF